MGPYRDPQHPCPACGRPLRAFLTRLVCDACNGMFLSLEDLAAAIHDMTSVVPAFHYKDEQSGRRSCPRCAAKLTTFKLRLTIENETFAPRPQLDRCATHGIWFDNEELAKVFEKVASKGFGGGVGRKTGDASRGSPANPGRWSAMFEKFGGHGGF